MLPLQSSVELQHFSTRESGLDSFVSVVEGILLMQGHFTKISEILSLFAERAEAYCL